MNRQRGRSLGNNSGTATWEGKPSKVKTHECIRHETRSEGLRAEQDVKRLRKPEGVAESGKENPASGRYRRKRMYRVTVAARGLTRWRVRNLMRGLLIAGVTGDGDGEVSERASRSRH